MFTMKKELINIGYSKTGSPSYTVRFTVDRKDIPEEFLQQDRSGGGNVMRPQVSNFLAVIGVSSISNEMTFVITKSIKSKEVFKGAIKTLTDNNPETDKLIAEFDKLTPVKGDAVWVKGTGATYNKEFGIALNNQFVPVITRTTVNPNNEAIQPVTNPTTNKIATYKEMPIYQSEEIGVGEAWFGFQEKDFVWAGQTTAEKVGS